MSGLNLNNTDKQDIQKFFNNIQGLKKREVDTFKTQFAYGNQAAWHRFIVGAYNHPLTWWIGIIQLQMQMGLWGYQYKAMASIRANLLSQITAPLRDEVKNAVQGESAPIISAIVKYNLKHHKADILGRLAGGAFTNYASTGGRFGNKRLPQSMKHVRTVTNLGLASYGAAIKAVVKGQRSIEAVIQSILTGRPEQLPGNLQDLNGMPLTEEEEKYQQALETAILEISRLTKISPGPIPTKEFCLKEENVNLKGICR